jgi:hypothetical protein
MKPLSIFLISLSFIGCTSSPDEIKKVYNDREEILSIFNNVSVFTKRLGGNIFLYTYNGGKQNQYVFTTNQNRYFLFRDSILFNPDVVLRINKDQKDSINYKKQLGEKVRFYIKKMDSLNISDISSEFFSHGIDFKIHMKTTGVLVYVPDIKKVDNPQWVNYIKSMRKFDENWYYSNEDE